jgi:hypothetical protein
MRVVRVLCVSCALSASALTMNGCTSMHRTPVNVAPQPPSPHLRSGDEVHVTMRDGRRARFRVLTADAASIIARDGSKYDRADILTIEQRQFSGVKTTLLVVGIVGVVLGAMVAAAAATVGL